MLKLAPSILSADFVNLERDVRALGPAGADYVHVDVMDGVFVPNITIGIPVVAALKKISPLPLDVHLMIDRPIRYVEDFCKAGADILTLHVESDFPLLPGLPLSLGVEIGLDVVDQGPAVLGAVVGVDGLAGLLVH